MVKLRHVGEEVARYVSDRIIDNSGFIKIIEVETDYIYYIAPFMFYTRFEVIG